jgi:hypothetical protein
MLELPAPISNSLPGSLRAPDTAQSPLMQPQKMKQNDVCNPSWRFMVLSKRFSTFIPLILTLLLALVLFFLVKDFIRTVIVVPLLHVIWFVSLILESISQGVIWAFLLLVMSIIAFNSFKKASSEKSQPGQLLPRNSGQVTKWAHLLDNAQTDRFAKWRLARELKRITQKLLSPLEDEKRYQNLEGLALPPEMVTYFETQQPTRRPFWIWLNQDRHEQTETALDLDPEVVIQYLEKRFRP